MADDIKLKILLNAVDHTGNAFSKIRKNTERVKSSMSSLRRGMGALTSLPTILSASVGAGAVKGLFNLGSGLEQSRVGFEVMLGSADKANKMIGNVNRLANKTPYENASLLKVTEMMLGFGVSHQKVLPYMSMLGDLSRGNTQRLMSLSLAFSQMQGAGKLMGQDLLQMINAGYNPLKDISKMTGKSLAQLKDEMSQGAISADLVSQAMKKATSEGGAFYRMSERMSQTGGGKLSTVMGQLNTNLAEVSVNLMPQFKATIDDVGGGMVSLSGWARDNTDSLRTMGTTVKWLGGAFLAFKAYRNINRTYRSMLAFKKLMTSMRKLEAIGNISRMARYTRLYGESAKQAAVYLTYKNKAVKVGTRLQMIYNNVIKKNPYTAMITGALALGAALYLIIKKMNTHYDVTKRMQALRVEAREDAREERAGLEMLFEKLAKTTKGSHERMAVLEKMRLKYPNYIKHLNLEKASLEEISQAYKDVAGNMEKKILAELHQKEMKKAIVNRMKYKDMLPNLYAKYKADMYAAKNYPESKQMRLNSSKKDFESALSSLVKWDQAKKDIGKRVDAETKNPSSTTNNIYINGVDKNLEELEAIIQNAMNNKEGGQHVQ